MVAIEIYNAANPEINPGINRHMPTYDIAIDILNEIDAASNFDQENNYIHPQAVKELRVLVALLDKEPAGYLRFGVFDWEGKREPIIEMVRVERHLRRQGIATRLMSTFLGGASGERLVYDWTAGYSSCGLDDYPSLKLHEKLGFIACGQIVIPEQEPELIYTRSFPEISDAGNQSIFVV